MKRTDLVRMFERAGWWLLRHGANHDIYTNGEKTVTIPRHREINERLARAILKQTGI